MAKKDMTSKMQTYIWSNSDTVLQYHQSIANIMKRIHSEIPKEPHQLNKVATDMNMREEHFGGANYNRVVMYLRTNGCEWALRDGYGCTMCGHLAKQAIYEGSVSADNFLSQFKIEFNKIDFEKYPILNLYNNGSFFNDVEIPGKARREMLRIIGETPAIRMVVIETRPEFVTEDKVMEVKELVPDKHFEIAIGLEMVDDYLRYMCINKGFSLKHYEEAAKIVTKYLNLRTYVMLKPPFLTEKEAVEQAIATIEHAFKIGSTTVSLEACTIQDFTLVKYLSECNEYKTTWLWSIIEVVKRTAHLGKMIVGLFQFYPSPSQVPCNCSECNYKVMKALKKYNHTLDVSVFGDLDCDCKSRWKKELQMESSSFDERIKILDHIF